METYPANPCKRVARRYIIEFSASMVAYLVMIFASRMLLEGPMRHADGFWQIAIAVSPVIPMAFLFAAMVRCILSADEMYRRAFVDSLAIAGGITAMLSVTYGLMEGPRVPHLSAWWTYTTFMLAYLVASIFVMRRYR